MQRERCDAQSDGNNSLLFIKSSDFNSMTLSDTPSGIPLLACSYEFMLPREPNYIASSLSTAPLINFKRSIRAWIKEIFLNASFAINVPHWPWSSFAADTNLLKIREISLKIHWIVSEKISCRIPLNFQYIEKISRKTCRLQWVPYVKLKTNFNYYQLLLRESIKFELKFIRA
jgi:hypothetical protein